MISQRVYSTTLSMAAALLAATVMQAASARAAEFNVANTADAGTWSLVTGQGFTATATSSADPDVVAGSTVYLSQFQFFQGNPDVAIPADTRLVIMNQAYPDFSGGASTSASYFVGASTNTIAAGSTFASGAALTFSFDNLPLIYGNTYAAGLFTVSGTSLTPVQLNVLTANYVETPAGSGTYLPATNYGGADNFSNAAYFNVAGNGFYSAYSGAGDTNFFATFVTAVPEPSTAAVGLVLMSVALRRRR